MTTMVTSDCTHNGQPNNRRENPMAFDANTYVNDYKKEHYKRITIEVSKEYYNDVLLPAVEKKGVRTNTFIKEAIAEKIERESK